MEACLLLGSNWGEREVYLLRAQERIAQDCGKIMKVSKVYETEPWGFEADTLFLNQALLIDTECAPQELLHRCLRIETDLGREHVERDLVRTRVYTSRVIDIDVLYYEGVVIESPELTLPHPRLHQRAFALEPLHEIAPEWVHPLLKITAKEMLQEL